MKLGNKEIKDECQYCENILQCDLCRQGHGINMERENVAKMFLCQMEHLDKRKKK